MDLEDLSEISDDWAIRKIFLDSSVTLLTRYSQSSVRKTERSWRRRVKPHSKKMMRYLAKMNYTVK